MYHCQPHQKCESFSCYTSSLIICAVILFNFSQPSECARYFIVISIHISLITYDVDNFSCAFESFRCYQSWSTQVLPILIMLLVLWYLTYRSSVYILSVGPLSDIYAANIFCRLIFLFIFLVVFTDEQIFVILKLKTYNFFLLQLVLFVKTYKHWEICQLHELKDWILLRCQFTRLFSIFNEIPYKIQEFFKKLTSHF